jgi:hypothetical protein
MVFWNEASPAAHRRQVMGRNFEVTFYREIVGGNGHCRAMPIDVLQIAQATTRETAIASAIQSFQQRNRVQCWNNLATHFAVSELAERRQA